ncbi:NAD(+) diphosphatase [Psychrobacter sp. I-STPA6b]|uniref:NAD(+) diphosphatase n=1 Tax=Psychrobacter sp. I-STPA6b TaxID=2585718 RepID=UPI001D0C7D2F|nr:NAD(+) diphosphatase [Psychrobacter sp. I-STPA6b]
MPTSTTQLSKTQPANTIIFKQDTVLCLPTKSGYSPYIASLPIFKSSQGSVALNLSQIGAKDMGAFTQVSQAITTTFAKKQGITWDSNAQFVPYRDLLTQLTVNEITAITHAMQLLRWQDETQFCSRCATAVEQHSSGEPAMVCPSCHLHQYPRIQPCVIIAITRTNPTTHQPQILLAHHHRHSSPEQSPLYALISGFVEVGESLEQAIHREVMEEVGVSINNIRYIDSQPWPYPSNLMLGFIVDYESGDITIEQAELSDAKFFDVNNLPRVPDKGTIARQLIDMVVQTC